MEVDVKLYYQSRLNESGTFHYIYFIFISSFLKACFID